MTSFKAAAIQMRSGLSVEQNTEDALRLIRDAAAAGARYTLTPEMTTILTLDRALLLSSIHPEADDPSLARFADVARELGIFVHIGSMAIRLEDGVANRSFLIDPDGAVVARYDKIHMFDVDLPGGESYRESRLYKPGDKAVIADLPWARLGFSICYDLRFGALYRALAAAGASVIAIPAAFTLTTGQAHWHVLQRTRAIETGSFVIAAAQGGHHEDDRDTFGHSLIVDPWGKVLAEADSEPGFILAEIDPAASVAARERVPSLANSRDFAPPAVPQPKMELA